jgi:hypothetical protein
MNDKCSNPECVTGKVREPLTVDGCGEMDYIWKPCHTCNQPKSEGPYFEDTKSNASRCSIDGVVPDFLPKYAVEVTPNWLVRVQNRAFATGRASLIPLVRELVGAMDEYYKEECSEGKALYEKAKKEIERG